MTQGALVTAAVEAARRPRLNFLVRAVLLSLLLLGLIAGAMLWMQGREQRVVLLDVVSPFIDLLAGILLFTAGRRTLTHSKRLGLAWIILGLSGLLYAIGDGMWSVLELVLKQAPFPSLADAFYLVYYPVFFAGVILLLQQHGSRGEIVNRALDLAVILIAAVLGFWNFLIGPILQSNAGAPPMELGILVAYPVGDLVMIGALLLIFYNDPLPPESSYRSPEPQAFQQPGIPVFLLAGGMLVMILTDCLYSYQTVLGTYESGGWLDLGWVVANLLLGLAGVAQWAGLDPGNAIGGYQPGPVFRARARWVKTYLPYAWLVGAFALLLVSAMMPLAMSFTSIAFGVSVILALVLIRQFITLADNRDLNRQLKDQASSLESINRDLNLEIGERLRIQEKLAFDVLHDHLTGLANRRLFLERLGQELKRSRRHPEVTFAVLFMDLDQFKVVNDSLGHSFGDQLLISVGRRLQQNLRSGDTVARFGGDEFAVLLDDLESEDSARVLAEKVEGLIGQPFRLQDRDVHITASVGIATDLRKYDYADDVLRDADLAMYQAKALGKARCMMFEIGMRDQVSSRLALEDGLRKAVQRGEFQLHYQPITSLESDRIVGLEALLRWNHPTRGQLLPAQFLSVAEDSDLILPIGDWVLNEACRQMKAWQCQYPHLASVAVNVNLSNREFSQPNLPGKIAMILKASQLSGSSLRLEITERVLVENYPTANEAIAALKELGVQVEIDDFGTGYSALAYLQQFPINAIKIDKGFISEMGRNRKGLGLVRAILSMARELGMEVVAEGIETGEQLSELKGLLCGFGQGFLLSAPLDADSLDQVLRKTGIGSS